MKKNELTGINEKKCNEGNTVPDREEIIKKKISIGMQQKSSEFDRYIDLVQTLMVESQKTGLSKQTNAKMKALFPFLQQGVGVELNVELFIKNSEKDEDYERSFFKNNVYSDKWDNDIRYKRNKGYDQVNSFQIFKAKNPLINKDRFQNMISDRIIKNAKATQIKPKDSPVKVEVKEPKKNIVKPVKKVIVTKAEPSNSISYADKTLSNHVFKIKQFWDGANTNYPYSFKKKKIVFRNGGKNIDRIEYLDHSKKMIPTMLLEDDPMNSDFKDIN